MGVLADDELIAVARVAEREGWNDLDSPPTAHGPRTLDEQRAVAAFCDLAAAPVAKPSARRPGASYEAKVRIGLLVVGVLVLGACWWISPERTALALLGAGLVCLIAVRRKRRRGAGAGLASHPFAAGVGRRR